MRDNQSALGSNASLCDRYYCELVDSAIHRLEGTPKVVRLADEPQVHQETTDSVQHLTQSSFNPVHPTQPQAEWPKDTEAEEQNGTGGRPSNDRMVRVLGSVIEVHPKEDPKKKNFLTKVPTKIAQKTMNKSTKNVESSSLRGTSGKPYLLHQKGKAHGSPGDEEAQGLSEAERKRRSEERELERVKVASKFVIGLAHKSKIPVVLPPMEPTNLVKVQQIRERAQQIRKVRKMAQRASSQAIQVIKSTFEDRVRKVSEEAAQRENRTSEQALAVLKQRSVPYDPEEMVSSSDQPPATPQTSHWVP